MSQQNSSLNCTVEREPLLRASKWRRQNLVDGRGSLRYHAMANDQGWWYWCGCLPTIRGVNEGPPSTLGPKRRKYKRWAGR